MVGWLSSPVKQTENAELRAQHSSMKVGFTAYAKTVKHHSLMLAGFQKKIEKLEQVNKEKDTRIDGLERRIDELQESIDQQQLRERNDEGSSAQSAIKTALEEQNILLRQVMEGKEDEVTELEQELTRMKTEVKEEREVTESSAVLEDLPSTTKDTDEDTETSAVKYFLKNAHEGLLEELEDFIANGIYVDTANSNGETALLLAAHGGHLGIVQILITNGANVDVATLLGSTTLMLAARQGHLQIVEVLIASGGNMNAVNSHNETALMGAAWWGHDNVVSALIATASLNNKGSDGNTALDFARQAKHPKVIKILTAAGAEGKSWLPRLFGF